MRLTILPLVIVLVGCTQEPPSEIVRKAEAAGAGNLRAASKEAMEDWFRKHPDVANEVRTMCLPVKAAASANWSDSTEGRVCAAAMVSAAFQFKERKGDGRGFDAVK